MEPPPFPRSTADLEEWSVYGDWLQVRGDPSGAWIARELALDGLLDPPALEDVQAHARTVCRQEAAVHYGFCLGHVRTAALLWSRVGRSGPPIAADEATLAHVTQVLRMPRASRLEGLVLPWIPGARVRLLRRLLDALPATCTRLAIVLLASGTRDAMQALLGLIPPQVSELALSTVFSPYAPVGHDTLAPLLVDRFDAIELEGRGAMWEDAARTGIRHTSQVRIRVDARDPTWRSARCELGRPGDDAALVDPKGGTAIAIRRPGLLDLQRRYGIIPVRIQLARSLPEPMEPAGREGFDLVRRPGGWTVRAEDPRTPIRRNGVELGEAPSAVTYGDILAVGETSWELVTRDEANRRLAPPS